MRTRAIHASGPGTPCSPDAARRNRRGGGAAGSSNSRGRPAGDPPRHGDVGSRRGVATAGELPDRTGRGGGPDLFGQIHDLALDDLGQVYVLEAQASEVRVFDADGKHARTFGLPGARPGAFAEPVAIEEMPGGRLLVVDYENTRFSVFDTAGTFPTSAMAARAGPLRRLRSRTLARLRGGAEARQPGCSPAERAAKFPGRRRRIEASRQMLLLDRQSCASRVRAAGRATVEGERP